MAACLKQSAVKWLAFSSPNGFIFCGRHFSHKSLKIGIVGAPFELGQPHRGLQKTPDLLRNRNLLQSLCSLGHDVIDLGDVEAPDQSCATPEQPGGKFFDEMLRFNKKLSKKVSEVIKSGRVCVTIGGDHSIGTGTVYGHAHTYDKEDMCLIWVDAHADLNTPETTMSGNTHGMPVSLHLKEIYASHYDRFRHQLDWFRPCLTAKRMAFIGLRDVDPKEADFIHQLGIPSFTMRDIDVHGVRGVLSSALDIINPNRDRAIHVSFDIDALDPNEAPATGTKVAGGLTLRDGLTLVEDIYQTGLLRALDLVEVNPDLAHSSEDLNKTINAARKIILAAMGAPRFF